MTPVYQTKFGGPDSPINDRRNCYSACLATILDLPLCDVPNFHNVVDMTGEPWHVVQGMWLRRRGLWAFGAMWTEEWNEVAEELLVGPYILNGGSPRGPWRHSVVAEAGEILHDPAGARHPDGPRLLETCDEFPWDVEVLVPFEYKR